MSWLGNGFREEAKALSDAYASMYKAAEEADEVIEETKEEPQQLDEASAGKIANATAKFGKGVVDAGLNVGKGAAKALKGAAETVNKTIKKEYDEAKPFKEEVEEIDEGKAQLAGKVIKALTPSAAAVGAGLSQSRKGYGPLKGLADKAADFMGYERKKKVNEEELLASLADAYEMMYEKKKDSDKCGEGTYWDKEEKKCKKKKSSKTTVVVGRGGIYGPGYHGGSNGGGDGDGGDTDGGDGGDGGGDGGGGGGE